MLRTEQSGKWLQACMKLFEFYLIIFGRNRNPALQGDEQDTTSQLADFYFGSTIYNLIGLVPVLTTICVSAPLQNASPAFRSIN